MRTLRSIPLPALLVATALLAVPSGAAGAKPSTALDLKIVPATPHRNQAITFRFRGDGKLKRNQRYRVTFDSADPRSSCLGQLQLRVPGFVPRGKLVTVRQPTPPGDGWCLGPASVAVAKVDIDGNVDEQPVVRTIMIRQDPTDVIAHVEGTPVRMAVRDGSTLTVKAPARPDRVLSVTGSFDGLIPSKFVLNSDFFIALTAGSLRFLNLATDPLCAGTTYTLGFPLAPALGSVTEFRRDGTTSMHISLNASTRSLAGCAGEPTGTASFELTGTLGEKKLADLRLSGDLIDNALIADGVKATITADLHFKIDVLDN